MTRIQFSKLDPLSTVHPESKPYGPVSQSWNLFRKPMPLWHLALSPSSLRPCSPSWLSDSSWIIKQNSVPGVPCGDNRNHETQTEQEGLPTSLNLPLKPVPEPHPQHPADGAAGVSGKHRALDTGRRVWSPNQTPRNHVTSPELPPPPVSFLSYRTRGVILSLRCWKTTEITWQRVLQKQLQFVGSNKYWLFLSASSFSPLLQDDYQGFWRYS